MISLTKSVLFLLEIPSTLSNFFEHQRVSERRFGLLPVKISLNMETWYHR